MVLPEVTDALREYIFDQMPIRLLKLPEMELVERRAVFQLLIPKMEDITEEYLAQKRETNTIYFVQRDTLVRDCIKERIRYAILSHTWLEDEVTFEDWKLGRNLSGPGYEKLQRFCQVAAAEYEVSLGWMDTICINKDSTSELDESIRSMYRWYENSFICLTYLANTTSLDDMPDDRWFTRGWTLQELLSPQRIKFYGKTWTPLTAKEIDNDKPSYSVGATPAPIHRVIEKATGITYSEMVFFKPGLQGGEISRRMVWAAKRTTTRGEDRAYSLMGIFSVTFTIAYGEGVERAFFRLVEQILNSYRNILDILNWARMPVSSQIHSSNMLPSRPECYLERATNLSLQGIEQTPSKPMILTHLGLRVRLLIVDADTPPSEDSKVLLKDGHVRMQCVGSLQKEPTIVHLQNIHDRDLFGPFRFTFKFVFGIWNIHESGRSIRIPDICSAFLFRVPHINAPIRQLRPLAPSPFPQFRPLASGGQEDTACEGEDEIEEEEEEETNLESCKVDTAKVISFPSSQEFRYLSREKDLATHGVKLRSVYL
ncbi:hypothetical protein BDZ97DRAFT_1733502 [Flammula alnicola]|nr:hypothetical protein BDZ97DRAFT_1733502 [Flammula alnicola]